MPRALAFRLDADGLGAVVLAAPQRPAAPPGGDARRQDAAFFDYVYLRANPDGLIAEHWYHGMGCRSWLTVTRDVRTHRIASVALAGDGPPATGGKAARGGE